MGYPILVNTASVCIPSFWHNTGVWRTDRWTDGCRSIYSACKVSCKKWKGQRYPTKPNPWVHPIYDHFRLRVTPVYKL